MEIGPAVHARLKEIGVGTLIQTVCFISFLSLMIFRINNNSQQGSHSVSFQINRTNASLLFCKKNSLYSNRKDMKSTFQFIMYIWSSLLTINLLVYCFLRNSLYGSTNFRFDLINPFYLKHKQLFLDAHYFINHPSNVI